MAEKSNMDEITLPEFTKEDKFIHQSARLRLISLLYVIEEADYVFLKTQTGLTWGNLSSHMDRLEERGYVEVTKQFKKKKSSGKKVPQTSAKLTAKGRKLFDAYREKIKEMEKLLEKAPEST